VQVLPSRAVVAVVAGRAYFGLLGVFRIAQYFVVFIFKPNPCLLPVIPRP
jgi:hypothetical protein